VIATAVDVRDLRPGDWAEVSRIFAEGIATGNATFETEVPSWEEWDSAHQVEHRSVAERGDRVLGWIALGFRVVGTRDRIGRLHGVWRDVLLLERRSKVVA